MDDQHTFHFHMNPSAISLSHAADFSGDAAVLPAGQAPDSGIDRPTSPTNTTLSMNLLIDRTYEKWDNVLGSDGVWHDVSVLYNVAGILPSGHTSSGDIGPLIPTYSWLLLNAGTGLWGMSYYGFIASLGIQYTHWSADMVPMRATASITFNVQQNPWNAAGSSNRFFVNGDLSPPLGSGPANQQPGAAFGWALGQPGVSPGATQGRG
ncbi:hypothetical protein [Pseudofrankia sp. BMG5.37]|uniref:hypothetical protein n=1 Tax=Pseudofrankia sp. BMG5.37 TaxID=3050035 RepID=UPI0028954271|nr:hypothetical protein [Pseudofrankia sp. BMG5.37]MDT3441770.1 hypothetical protein [Pseudofrankia sp. BMG5.37]